MRDDRWQTERVSPGPDKVIGRRLARRIGRMRIIARRLGEEIAFAERAEHLVGRHMQETEAFPLRPFQFLLIRARCLKQRVRAYDIGLHEDGRRRDRTIDVALGR